MTLGVRVVKELSRTKVPSVSVCLSSPGKTLTPKHTRGGKGLFGHRSIMEGNQDWS